MMAPYYYKAARRCARIHAQIWITSAHARNGSMQISGRYVRVFKGFLSGAIPGRIVRLSVPLVSLEPDAVPVLDGMHLYHRNYFDGARWLELYLEPRKRGVRLVGGILARLERPTLLPAF
jgi:hypothetical protein